MPAPDDSVQPNGQSQGTSSLSLHSGSAAIDSRLNIDQMLSLIDSVLPFEACLFYQVIPLSIQASHLNLGMVNPDDSAAADYSRRQISYINCSMVSWPIESDWHREMLSKYLSHAAKMKQRSRQTSPSQAPESTHESAERLTFIVDSPDDIPLEAPPSVPVVSMRPAAPAPTSPPATAAPGLNPSPLATPPPLQLDLGPDQASSTLNNLRQFPPKQLMQALLKQVLAEGIGRLYFERRATLGRVLCSQDGQLEAVLDDLNVDLFQSVINEFKRLTHLPMLPTTKTKQVEIERLYHQERVLLRFRLIAGTHGEEATLQVLRGAALKFHQQQQIDRLGRDALGMAQSLQQRINEIRTRARQALSLESASTDTLAAVRTLLKDMDAQIAQLINPPKGDVDDSAKTLRF
ncbi:MAG: hypothetical protein ACFCVD_14655 [Nodosilinea sp.]